MKVRVKLLSPAGDMPRGFDPFGEAEKDLATGATVADVIGQIELPKEESYTSLVNGQPVTPDDRAGSHPERRGRNHTAARHTGGLKPLIFHKLPIEFDQVINRHLHESLSMFSLRQGRI